ncbi:hypothetical protein BDV19DRAFT_203105 [Aspergillus venezuelensis]
MNLISTSFQIYLLTLFYLFCIPIFRIASSNGLSTLPQSPIYPPTFSLNPSICPHSIYTTHT